MNTTGVEIEVPMKARKENKELPVELESVEDDWASGPEPFVETQLAEDVESFFQDEPEYTVIIEDFREALDAQVTYYKGRIAFHKTLCGSIRRERDEAQSRIHLIGVRSDNVSCSTNSDNEVRQIIDTIKTIIKEGSRKLKELKKFIPISLELGRSDNRGLSSSIVASNKSTQKDSDLGINRLVDDFSASVQIVIDAIQSAISGRISSSSEVSGANEQHARDSCFNRADKHTTCRQRLKERELEIGRLEDRIRRSGGVITDCIPRPALVSRRFGLNLEEVILSDAVVRSLQGTIEAAMKNESRLKSCEELLPEQLAADPTDESGAAKKLKEIIERLTAEKAKVDEMTGEYSISEFSERLDRLKLALEVERGYLNKNEVPKPEEQTVLAPRLSGTDIESKLLANITNLESELKEKTNVIDKLEAALDAAQTAAQINSNPATNNDEPAALASKTIIDGLTREVHDLHARAAVYIEETRIVKADSAREIADLKKNLAACMLLYLALIHSKKDANS